MDHADSMRAAVDVAVTAVRAVDPAHLDDPSPCRDYTLGGVANHLAFGLLLAERAALRQEWDAGWTGTDDAPYLVGQPPQRWAELVAEQGERTAAAWADPRVWEGDTTFGGAPMPAEAVGAMMTAEFVVHGWDVARAAGTDVAVAPELGDAALAGVEAMAPAGRDGGWFAPPVEVPADAPSLVKALGESGRDPHWTP